MAVRPYDLVHVGGTWTARVRARGRDVLAPALLNRGTAFTEQERERLELTGFLPDGVSTLEGQVRRVYGQYTRQPTALDKHVYLSNLRDRNEVLFHRLLADHLEEMLPIVYTPTIGTAIERFSQEYQRPRGVYLSIDRPEEVHERLAHTDLTADDVDLIVATDGEGILGIGDWGVGGQQIAVGKLSVYTAAAGVHPLRALPVMLDTGTDNPALLNDDFYLGIRHARVRDERYDAFIEAFVTTATKLFPYAMLHWEDLAAANARRVLANWADRCCTFNDDMQGTAAVVLAAAWAATETAGTRLREARIVVHGAGTAGIGIADMLRDAMIAEGLSPAEATARFWAVDRRGLLTSDQTAGMRDFQAPYARPPDEVAGWGSTGSLGLAEVVRHVHPTILIGTSAQAGAFTEAIVREMAAHCERPIIMPLSNPTSRAEAVPADLVRWTAGRVLTATGSPFAPVEHGGRTHEISQANNALIFPGLGLGVVVARAGRVSNGMLMAAARALASIARGTALLPPVTQLRAVSATVAAAVARTAQEEGLARLPLTELVQQIHDAMWRPAYPALDII
ncbi:MAG TPA: NAD-dependent malic enzyme [Sporichthyaceae bacterium]|nr:NAD-dependent malic enzyme [Sporichthyaceae bacterium]